MQKRKLTFFLTYKPCTKSQNNYLTEINELTMLSFLFYVLFLYSISYILLTAFFKDYLFK